MKESKRNYLDCKASFLHIYKSDQAHDRIRNQEDMSKRRKERGIK